MIRTVTTAPGARLRGAVIVKREPNSSQTPTVAYYYSSLKLARSVPQATIMQRGDANRTHALTLRRDYSVQLELSVPPNSYEWFVIV